MRQPLGFYIKLKDMKHLGILIKLAATVALFWIILSKVDPVEMASKLKPLQIVTALTAGVAVLSIQVLIGAMRLRYCVRLLGRNLSLRESWITCQYGGFFSHTPISFVGGDAMRVWNMVKIGLPLAESAKAILIDRALGFFCMMTLVLLSAPLLYSAIKEPRMWGGYLIILSLGIGLMLAFFALGRHVSIASNRPRVLRRIVEIVTVSKYLGAYPERALKAFICGLAITSLNVVAIWVIGIIYANGIDLRVAFAAAPIVFLIAMFPVSVAGWGLREGAFLVAFGLFGVPASIALTVSTTFGIAVLLAYSPAAILIVLARRQGVSEEKGEEFEPASSSSQPQERS